MKATGCYLKAFKYSLSGLCVIKALYVIYIFGWDAAHNNNSLISIAIYMNGLSLAAAWFLAVWALLNMDKLTILSSIVILYCLKVDSEISALSSYDLSLTNLIEIISSMVLLLLLAIGFILAYFKREKGKTIVHRVLESYQKCHLTRSPMKAIILSDLSIWVLGILLLVVILPYSGLYTSGLYISYSSMAFFYFSCGFVFTRMLLIIKVSHSISKSWSTLDELTAWHELEQKLQEFKKRNSEEL